MSSWKDHFPLHVLGCHGYLFADWEKVNAFTGNRKNFSIVRIQTALFETFISLVLPNIKKQGNSTYQFQYYCFLYLRMSNDA